ncbi:MAG TPA: hypothetical protein PKN50_12510 [Spirochaetota bacterium]|nr:hypothetical protein [Spirochaetota bacterium]HPV42664.1 hypothetical protein [Spirochaetota bacterium]
MKSPGLRRRLFSDREWSGYVFILKAVAAYIVLGAVLTLAVTHPSARACLEHLPDAAGFPVYVLIAALLLGVPAFNLCRAAVAKYKTKSRGLPAVLAVIAAFGVCVIMPQLFLPRLFPVFTSLLGLLFVIFFFLWGLWIVIARIIRSIRRALKGS